MKYRRLGGTGLTVSVVTLGTWQFGGEWGKDFAPSEVDAVVGRAKERGINLIDTAECYGDHLSERLVGNAVRRDRDTWLLASKFGHRYLGDGSRRDEWAPAQVVEQLDRTLRALGTDYLDLYQFHSGDDAVFDRPELWEALRGQVAAGKVRHLGVSLGANTNAGQVERAPGYGTGAAVQVVYSRLDREPEGQVLPACERVGTGVIAREVLAGGLLTGKYPPGTRFVDPTDTRSGRDQVELDARLDEVARLREAELPPGVDMASWALAWALQHPAVSTVLAGCKSVEQVDANAAAADLGLVDETHPLAV